MTRTFLITFFRKSAIVPIYYLNNPHKKCLIYLIHLLLLFSQDIMLILPPTLPQVSTTPDVSTPLMVPTTGAPTASMRKKPVAEVSHFLNTYPFLYPNIFQIDKMDNFVRIKKKLIYFFPTLFICRRKDTNVRNVQPCNGP